MNLWLAAAALLLMSVVRQRESLSDDTETGLDQAPSPGHNFIIDLIKIIIKSIRDPRWQIAVFIAAACINWLYGILWVIPISYYLAVAVGLIIIAIPAVRYYKRRRSKVEKRRQAWLTQEKEIARLREASEAEDAAARRRREYERKMRDFVLTCTRCSRLAQPVPGTGSHYHCESCGNRFVGGQHDVELA
jgi:hypothetical protein